MACVYAGSRTLTALAETGYAPKIFAYVDKSGRPLFSLIFIIAFGPIAYVNLADVGNQVFNWLLALSGLSTIFTWLAIVVTHIRFRKAWKVQGHSTEELPFKAIAGVWGSWVAVFLIAIVLIAQFYIGLFPVGGVDGPGARAESFFRKSFIEHFLFLPTPPFWAQLLSTGGLPSRVWLIVIVSYLAAPIVLAFWLVGYIWKRGRPRRAHEIDLDTGRKSWLTVEDMRQYRAERALAPWYVRTYRILFSAS